VAQQIQTVITQPGLAKQPLAVDLVEVMPMPRKVVLVDQAVAAVL
jgi:hypothetical protein